MTVRALLLPNNKPESLRLAARAGNLFIKLGGRVLLDEHRREQVPVPGAVYAPFWDCVSRCELILAVGGDGTIIHAAKHALAENKLVLGVNAGYLGFLAQAEQDELEPLFGRLLAGDYRVEERFVLSASIEGGQRPRLPAFALNDAVVARGQDFTLAGLQLYCDGKYMDSFRADGVIFSTPTGSTAYSMSAGGPIVDPTMDAILMTPISPHRLTARATIFSAAKTVVVRPQQGEKAVPLFLSVDGGEPQLLEGEEYVKIQKAPKAARFVTFGEKEFFEILTKKIVQRG